MEIIENISTYKLYNNSLYYRTMDREFYIIENYKSYYIKSEKNDIISFTDNSNYVYDRDTRGCKVENHQIKKLSLKLYQATNEGGEICVSPDTMGSTLFRLPEEQQILSEWLPNRIFHVQDQYWVNDTEADFKLIDVNKGEIVWTIPQPTVEKPYGYNGLTNIKKVLGIYKDCLWLQLPDSRLWKLDLHTGRVLEELEAFYFASIPEGIFLSQQGIVFILHYNIYAQYSLEQGIFTIDKKITNENELIIRYVLFEENDNYLYFTGNKDQSFSPNVYGIFDMETETIVFQGEMIEEGGYFYEIPQVNDELFTILDAKGNLIIHRLTDIL